jgi:hypothetical protein
VDDHLDSFFTEDDDEVMPTFEPANKPRYQLTRWVIERRRVEEPEQEDLF